MPCGYKKDGTKLVPPSQLGKKRSKETIQRLIDSHVGKHCNPAFEFKKGTPQNEHPRWKGEDVGYHALHHWVKLKLVKPEKCSMCCKKRVLEVSNRDHKYRRNLDDYWYLCRSCHRKYDIENNGYVPGFNK